MGADLAAAGADRHARLPGRALADGEARCRARPATTIRPAIPTGVFPTSDGHINIAASGDADLRALLRGARRAAAWRPIRTSPRDRPRSKNRDALNARSSEITRKHDQRRLDRAAERGRRAVRADLHDRPDVRRPAGAASRHGGRRAPQKLGDTQARRPADRAVAHAEPACAARRPSTASTPTRSCASSAMTRRRSRPARTQGDLTPRLTAGRQTADASTERGDEGEARAPTKMIAEKDGGDRPDHLQQSGAPQRRLARDVAGGAGDHRRFRGRRRDPRRGARPAPAARPSSRAPTFPSSRRSAPPREAARLQRDRRARERRAAYDARSRRSR